MEIKAKRGDLLATLYWTQNIVERRNTIPILANVLVAAQKKEIHITATDLEVGVRGQVEGEVAVGHRHDGVDGVRIAAADEVAELLVDDVDLLSLVVLGGGVLQMRGDDVADAAAGADAAITTNGIGRFGAVEAEDPAERLSRHSPPTL